jgi:MFS family permease
VTPAKPAPPIDRRAALHFIVCLGVVSLFADVTYEGARGIAGPFFKSLGASAAQLGVISGLGEFCGFTLRLASGYLADRTRAYWTITILGYAVNLFAVPLLAFAGNWPAAAVLVIAERTGKSLRAPARDVLLSEAAHSVGQGWAFGLHAALDQTGAVIGPLFVAWAVARAHSYGPAFLYLAIPAGAALAMLLIARSVSPVALPSRAERGPGGTTLPRIFWLYIAAAGMLAIGFCDFPLIAYHFEKTALAAPATIPLLYAGAMVLNGATAPLFGKLFDRFGIAALAGGILVSLFALPLSFFGELRMAMIGVACWGAGMGAMDATLRAGISQVVAMDKRGRAFGIFNAAYGVAWLAGSSAMGFLYDSSILGLVALGVVAQLASATLFFALRGNLQAARRSPAIR